jgi:hypothetical protein
VLTINGTVNHDLGGAVFNAGDNGSDGKGNDGKGNNDGNNNNNGGYGNSDSGVPPPGKPMTGYMKGMAGGAPPHKYKWGTHLTDEAFEFIQLLQFLDNALLELLWSGHRNLTVGAWNNMYPQPIVKTLGSMGAQALVHRHSNTDCMQHFKRSMVDPCRYSWPISNVDDFVETALVLLLLEIGVLLDAQATLSSSHPWLVPIIGSNLGSKSRMTAVINMMQNHMAATAPREVMLPPDLVYSYVANKYVVDGSCPTKMRWADKYAEIELDPNGKEVDPSGRTKAVKVKNDVGGYDAWMAWVGPWGDLDWTKIDGQGRAEVPGEMYGHVWAVVCDGKGEDMSDLEKKVKAGPEMVWVTEP